MNPTHVVFWTSLQGVTSLVSEEELQLWFLYSRKTQAHQVQRKAFQRLLKNHLSFNLERGPSVNIILSDFQK